MVIWQKIIIKRKDATPKNNTPMFNVKLETENKLISQYQIS